MTGAVLAAFGAGVSPVVNIDTVTVQHVSATPANAFARYMLEADGDIVKRENVTDTDLGDWVTPKTFAGAAYDCRMTTVSGTVSPGSAATGSWLSLGSDRSWNVQIAVVGTKTYVGTLEIRRASDGVVLDTATITLTAQEA